jgi:oxygen-independent coproporphyrinogen-3 oxidase
MFPKRDNEFVAWYPPNLDATSAGNVWTKRPSSFYVHIPFCTAICDYCGFAVERLKDRSVTKYFEALELEIKLYSNGRLSQNSFYCGHFGGGTPSSVDPAFVSDVVRKLRDGLDLSKLDELTIEVNPIGLTPNHFAQYRSVGFNRISVGIQSFSDKLLKTMGRPHRASDTALALEMLRDVSWENFSLDLMYGIPGQTLDELQSDLETAIASGAHHITCYQLELIPFTVLKLRHGAGELPGVPSPELLDSMENAIIEKLERHTYRQYGAFNFAKSGYESQFAAMTFGAPQHDMVGFGNSAYSFANGYIYANHASVAQYERLLLSGENAIALAREVSPLEQMRRFFVLGLKYNTVSTEAFTQCFGIHPTELFGETLRRLVEGGMLISNDASYELTKLGRRYVNNVIKEFFSSGARGTRQHLQVNPNITAKQVEFYAARAKLNGISRLQ